MKSDFEIHPIASQVKRATAKTSGIVRIKNVCNADKDALYQGPPRGIQWHTAMDRQSEAKMKLDFLFPEQFPVKTEGLLL